MISSVIAEYGYLIKWLGIVSTFTFLASLFCIPWIIYKLKDDYFLHLHKQHKKEDEHPLLFILLRLLRYLMGSILLSAGILMLFLPGQGLLTMILGLSLLDFPAKQRAVDSLLQLQSLRKALNWIRDKEDKKPFIFPEAND